MADAQTDAAGRGRIAELWRYPVKSMQGEAIDAATVSASGVYGDRAWAALDVADGRVGSAKHPRKWGALLNCRARTIAADSGGASGVEITMPDGAVVREGPDADAALSDFLGRAVKLVPSASGANAYEGIWPDIEGLAPDAFINGMRSGGAAPEGGGTVLNLQLAANAPGTLLDVAALHIVTRESLAALAALAPDAEIGVARFRPNVVVEWGSSSSGTTAEFVEDQWTGQAVQLGGVTAVGFMPTMRCIMTTLAQPGISARPDILRTLATHHRLKIGGGQWACLGLYADVKAGGEMRVGDEVAVTAV
jgi:uncharacterized protein YcbX